MHDTGDERVSIDSPSDPSRLELSFALDDATEPSELTIFPRNGADLATTWISIDIDSVVDLTEMA